VESNKVVDSKGNIRWYNENEQRHRDDDLPAIEWANGTKEWYKKGNLHRDKDLPAIEWKDGTKFWYKNGLPHRDGDLPAVEYPNGHKEWWVDGDLVVFCLYNEP